MVNKAIYLSSSQFITWSISVECINDLCLLLHFPLLKLLQMQKAAEEEEVGSETEMKIGCLNVIDTVIKLCTDGWDYTVQLSGLLVDAIQRLTHGGSNYLTYNRTPNNSRTPLRGHNTCSGSSQRTGFHLTGSGNDLLDCIDSIDRCSSQVKVCYISK